MHRSRLALVLGSVFAVVAVVAVLFAFQSSQAAEPAHLNPPSRIAVLGDSISRGYSANNVIGEHPELNWATGTSLSVNSLFRRLQLLNPAIAANNDAVSGAKMSNLAGQAANAVAQGADYVVIEMGGNDACTSTVTSMTSVTTYRAQFQTAMNVLSQGLPNARIYVASVPDVWYLWNANRNNAVARFIWSLAGICQSLLAQPTCMTQACIDRRAAVEQRAHDFSHQLDEVCDQYIHCDFDDFAINSTPFTAADISTGDYFHPSIRGQNLLADGAWLTGPNFLDTTAPQSTISPDRAPDGVDGWYKGNVTITLTATDLDSAVSGTEYYYQLEGALGSTPWIRYTAPFTITSEGTTIVSVRSVDVNGNSEAVQEKSIKIDKTAPSLSLDCPASVPYLSSASFTLSASDDRSGFDPDPNGTYPLDTSVVGSNLNEISISDRAGNQTTGSCTYTVENANPVVTTTPDPSSGTVGVTLGDAAALSGGFNPTGEIAFNLFAPSDPACEGTPALTNEVTVTGNGDYHTSSGFASNAVGIWHWTAAYSGDDNNNPASTACAAEPVHVQYLFGGVRQPINADGSSIFKRGSTVPVKFQLRDANGNLVETAVATLSVAKISDDVEGTYVEAVSTSAATTGNLFRSANGQYIFNLGTKTLTAGTYRLRIALDDGDVYYVQISLR